MKGSHEHVHAGGSCTEGHGSSTLGQKLRVLIPQEQLLSGRLLCKHFLQEGLLGETCRQVSRTGQERAESYAKVQSQPEF